MPKLSQKTIFIISGIALFLVIATLFAFFYNSNSQNKSANSSNSSQNSTSNNSNSSVNSNITISSSTDSSFTSSDFANSDSPAISVLDQNNSSSQSLASLEGENLQLENLTINNSKSQTYTNPNYPNLKINYDNSWKLERTNRKSIKNDNPNGQLMDGELILTKNNTKLVFSFIMPQRFGGGGMDDKILADLGKFKRYNQSIPAISYEAGLEKDKYVYSKSQDKMMTNIKTNIDKSEITEKELKYIIPSSFDSNQLNYWLYPTLHSTNPAEIAQADEIIKNSILE